MNTEPLSTEPINQGWILANLGTEDQESARTLLGDSDFAKITDIIQAARKEISAVEEMISTLRSQLIKKPPKPVKGSGEVSKQQNAERYEYSRISTLAETKNPITRQKIKEQEANKASVLARLETQLQPYREKLEERRNNLQRIQSVVQEQLNNPVNESSSNSTEGFDPAELQGSFLEMIRKSPERALTVVADNPDSVIDMLNQHYFSPSLLHMMNDALTQGLLHCDRALMLIHDACYKDSHKNRFNKTLKNIAQAASQMENDKAAKSRTKILFNETLQELLSSQSGKEAHKKILQLVQQELLSSQSAKEGHKKILQLVQQELLSSQSAKEAHKKILQLVQQELLSSQNAKEAHRTILQLVHQELNNLREKPRRNAQDTTSIDDFLNDLMDRIVKQVEEQTRNTPQILPAGDVSERLLQRGDSNRDEPPTQNQSVQQHHASEDKNQSTLNATAEPRASATHLLKLAGVAIGMLSLGLLAQQNSPQNEILRETTPQLFAKVQNYLGAGCSVASKNK